MCHDLFDNFIEKIDFYKSTLDSLKNHLIVLFNFPGQAYTLFDPNKIYNNDYNATLLDLLIYDLQQREYLYIRSDNIRFIGYGLGGNILLYFRKNYLS